MKELILSELTGKKPATLLEMNSLTSAFFKFTLVLIKQRCVQTHMY